MQEISIFLKNSGRTNGVDATIWKSIGLDSNDDGAIGTNDLLGLLGTFGGNFTLTNKTYEYDTDSESGDFILDEDGNYILIEKT